LSEIAAFGNIKIISRDSIRQIMHLLSKNRKAKCFTPSNSLFITCKGDIYPCIYMGSIGNVKEKGWEDSIFSEKHMNLILKSSKADCPGCIAYHGFLRNSNFNH